MAMAKWHYSYGEYDEIAFTSRNEMNLAVWEGKDKVRLYSYGYDDTFRERVGRFLHNGLTQLWEDKRLFDLDVVVGGQLFQCHGVVLASVSEYFLSELTSEQLRSQRQAGQPDTITLDDTCVSPDTFEMLLDMIYNGRDIIQEEHALDLMKAATYLGIRALELRCMDVLIKQITESSCMEIWDWAERNNVPYLASKAKGVALSNFLVLRHTEHFLHMPLERLTLMLGHELLNYRYEDDILEAILDWVEFDTADRRQHLKELLPFVCFPYLSTRYLNDLRKHPLIGLGSEFASYVDEALTYHLAALQKDGKKIQMEVLKRQAHTLKRLMPGMRRVVMMIGGTVVQDEPLTTVVAVYLDMAHPQNRYRDVLQFSVASLPVSLGLRFASTMWKHDIYVSGGSRSPDTLLVYKPHENAWHRIKGLPEGREDHAMVAADAKLYLLGGRVSVKGGVKVIADVGVYDLEADDWKAGAQLLVAVEAAPAVLYSDKIYIFGGRTASGEKVGLIQCLDLTTGEVEVVGELPEEVEGARAIVLGKDIVLVCPQGSIYKIHENSRSRRPTATDQHDIDEELLSSLDLLPEKPVRQWERKVKFEDEKENKEQDKSTAQLADKDKTPDQNKTAAQPAGKGKAKGGQVDWSILDAKVKEHVPTLKRTTGDDEVTTPGFRQKDSTDTKQPHAPSTPKKEAAEKTSMADAEETEENVDDDEDVEWIDMKEEEQGLPSKNHDTAESDHNTEDEEEQQTKAEMAEEKAEKMEKKEKKDEDSEQKMKTEITEDDDDIDETEEADIEDKKPEDAEEDEEEDEDEIPQEEAASPKPVKPLEKQMPNITITKIATMEKRRDFGLFIRKADVMVVGGQSENGYFLDDILKIHIPTGQVCKTEGKLVIPISGMQVESTNIHQNYLLQFFDAASCFYGE